MLPPLFWVDALCKTVTVRPDRDNPAEVVQALKTFYAKMFSGRPEGDAFDDNVMDALDLILLDPELWKVKRARSLDTTHLDSTHGCG